VQSLFNYASLLEDVWKDYDSAEQYYLRAIKANPKHVGALCNYALLLENAQNDYEAAEVYYKQALEADPENTGTLDRYAQLLQRNKSQPPKMDLKAV
jgi:tetratricopeptide (TPR) repeat protein